ncbi:MAG: ATP synthase F1 subunit delta [Sphingomonadales bacterium]|nr:ATP synthase F1 subunit delta [Sphingomonadales bacterium]
MNNPRIATRYAVSLLRLATERGQEQRIYQDMVSLSAAISGSKDLDRLFRSPLIKPDVKIQIVKKLFATTFDALTLGFLNLAIRKHRESEMGGMAKAFVRLFENQKGVVRVEIQTASVLDESNRSKLESKLTKAFGQGAAFGYKQNPELLGGYVLKSGDLRVDASMASELQQIRRQFSDNPYLSKV